MLHQPKTKKTPSLGIFRRHQLPLKVCRSFCRHLPLIAIQSDSAGFRRTIGELYSCLPYSARCLTLFYTIGQILPNFSIRGVDLSVQKISISGRILAAFSVSFVRKLGCSNVAIALVIQCGIIHTFDPGPIRLSPFISSVSISEHGFES